MQFAVQSVLLYLVACNPLEAAAARRLT
jgi:hypothetical protein